MNRGLFSSLLRGVFSQSIWESPSGSAPVDLTSYPSAFFNGLDFRLATYTGGPTYAADNLGVLRSPGSNRPAVQGMRLATTLADGAVLGPELITNAADREFTSDTGFWTKGPGWTIANGIASHSGSQGNLSRIGLFTAGKQYVVSGYSSNNINIYIGNSTFIGPVSGNFTVYGYFTGTNTLYIQSSTEGYVDSVSVKEVIPTYVSTDSSGNPIVASTPQKTVTYSTDWLSKTFAETFDKFDISDPLKAPGWLCEPVRTNKVTCRKSNPVDTSGLTKGGDAAAILSVVDDTAALTAAGLIGLCNSGKVYKLDNSLGTATSYAQCSGTVANTNGHVTSAYIRVSSGEGNVQLINGTNSNPVTSSSYVLSAAYTAVPGSVNNVLAIVASPGAVVYFILPQLEEGAFATSPICKAADGTDPLTSLTRAATIASFPTAGKIRPNNMAFRLTVVPRSSYISQSTAHRLFSLYYNTSNRFVVLFDGSVDVLTVANIVSGVGASTSVSLAISRVKDVPIDIIFIKTSAYGCKICFRKYVDGFWSAWTNSAYESTATAKADWIVPTTYQLGAQNSVEQFTGNISELNTLFIPDGIADPLAWAKTHWGVA